MSLNTMQEYLTRSISSFNQNKLNGLLAEIDFRNYLNTLGFGDKISVGGWIARNEGPGVFGHNTIAIFQETISPEINHVSTRSLPEPAHGLHTICATFHQIGIHSYFCATTIHQEEDTSSIQWHAVRMGLPTEQEYDLFPDCIDGFNTRSRRYNFLRYHSDITGIPSESIPEEFSKEHLRITFQNTFLCEMSDIDGILWGNQYTYPIEIKEKTPAQDRRIGDYFGLDIGPFVKLAFYAAKKGNLHSIFVVREIDDESSRNLVCWWFITFERLAQFASWIFSGGGRNMQGGRSSVVRIPKAEFRKLTAETLEAL